MRKLWVATMNVAGHDFDRHREAAIAFIKTDAAIIGFQEMKADFWKVFESQGHSFVRGLETNDHQFYVPIAYDCDRLDLLLEDSGYLTIDGRPGKSFDDGAERTYTIAVLREKATGIEVVVGNAHFGFAPESIRESMKLLTHEVNRRGDEYKTPYRILMGDFNMNLLPPPAGHTHHQAFRNRRASAAAHAHAEREGFKEATLIATTSDFTQPRERRFRTFNNWATGEPYPIDHGATIDPDYIYVQGFDVALTNPINTEVGGVMASDHLWYLAQLRYDMPGED